MTTVAEKLAQEFLDMQQGSVEDAMVLLCDGYFTMREHNAIAKAIHELGDPSNCECSGSAGSCSPKNMEEERLIHLNTQGIDW